MNYPIWDLQNIGGGTLIAFIAVIHAFVAHLAVGGGLFLILTETIAARNNDQQLMAYVQKHTKFFLLLTMVFGGITGVGIWFSISLVNPAATSALIHHFVFGWATEWVFFMAEIVSLLIYHYRFGKMDPQNHRIIGWLYFIFAWLSLFIINGILTFMLTPGNWIETQRFWHGFFNPGMWPALFYRSGISFLIAGLFGLITALRAKNGLKEKLFNYCLRWIYLPAILIIVSGFWYFKMTPATSLDNVFHFNPESVRFVNYFIFGSIFTFIIGLVFLLKLPTILHKFALVLLIIAGFTWFAGFEYIREIARKPFILNEYMYSNSIIPGDLEKINNEGFLKLARWSAINEVTDDNLLDAGKDIFRLQCHACHTVNGYNAIAPRTNRMTERGLLAHIEGLGKINNYMPPFAGTMKEKQALAAYLYRNVQGKTPKDNSIFQAEDLKAEPEQFDQKTDNYVLLAWNDLGMHCISDNDKYFSFLPPANALWCQLIKRGPKPEIMTTGYNVAYEIEDGHKHPEKHVDFWQYAKTVYGGQPEIGVGLKGVGLKGEMHSNPDKGVFTAEMLPVTPYNDNGKYNPYPMFTLKAYNEQGELLIATKVIAPTSTEMGCRNCHQGDWRWNNVSGLSELTSQNILKEHDRLSKTQLLKNALNGQPKLCQSCHADPAVGAPGIKEVPNFSSAIHGFHANYLPNNDHNACIMCHPAKPNGNTRCSRGVHNTKGLTCIDCHGTFEDHALALLKHPSNGNIAGVEKMMANLVPRQISSKDAIIPRMPWLNEPNCLACHKQFDVLKNEAPKQSFNQWFDGFNTLYRNSTDNHGVMCASCHSSPHAIYNAENMYGTNRDNLQPIQYQHVATTLGADGNCSVCHTIEMKTNGHHRNMIKN